MVTATQSPHTKELSARGGKAAGHRLSGVLDTEKRSSTACRFERALREKVAGQDQKMGCRPKHHLGGKARGSTYAESVAANIGVKNEFSF
jgi:hypothetical protein